MASSSSRNNDLDFAYQRHMSSWRRQDSRYDFYIGDNDQLRRHGPGEKTICISMVDERTTERVR